MPSKAALFLVVALALVAGIAWYGGGKEIGNITVEPPPSHREPSPPLYEREVVVGYWECLPKKGPGPHTMECAFGIAKDQSDGHLAVNTQLMSTYPVDYPVGTKVRIEGVVMPAAALSSDHWQQYDIDGIISATSIQKVP